jgi:hypothetical protein
MLYRAHRPNSLGSYGSQLGYISLCDGYINVDCICGALRVANLIPSSWFASTDLTLVKGAPNIDGNYQYVLMRRILLVPLFYLMPIESKTPKLGYISTQYKHPGTFTFTGNINGNIPIYAPMYIPNTDFGYTIPQQTIANQERDIRRVIEEQVRLIIDGEPNEPG